MENLVICTGPAVILVFLAFCATVLLNIVIVVTKRLAGLTEQPDILISEVLVDGNHVSEAIEATRNVVDLTHPPSEYDRDISVQVFRGEDGT